MRIFMLAAAFSLQSCSYSYPVLARTIGGRLAFVSGDRHFDCISIIRVTAMGPRDSDPAIDAIADPIKRGEAIGRARAAWTADGISFTCEAHYPVFYGAALPNMPVVVPPKTLRIGRPYSVSVMGPNGSGGDGCFRITPDRQAENLPDRECVYSEPMPSEPPAPAAEIVAPAEPSADPQSLIGPDDYPDWSLRMGEQGIVRFALDVGADGRAGACTVTRPSGAPTLDSLTCRIMLSRARFTPARDSNGNPAASRVEQAVRWTLPSGASARVDRIEQWGNGMISHSAPPPVIAVDSAPIRPEPIMAVPQHGRGPAELSVWDPRGGDISNLGKYRSISACRRKMATLRLQAGQKAHCTLAAKKHVDLGIH
jgi:TonB family protein